MSRGGARGRRPASNHSSVPAGSANTQGMQADEVHELDFVTLARAAMDARLVVAVRGAERQGWWLERARSDVDVDPESRNPASSAPRRRPLTVETENSQK